MKSFAFIDASNLFYGGEKSLGWKIDYKKLIVYLREKYEVSRVLYFGGVEIHGLPYDYLENETVELEQLREHLERIIKAATDRLNEAELILIGRHLDRVKFYQMLEKSGYELILKPVKRYNQEDGSVKRKANCDVDMTFRMMEEKDNFSRILVLSGDGDFLPVLKHLKSAGKEVIVMGRGPRTAKEIKQFAGGEFKDFEYLRNILKWEKK